MMCATEKARGTQLVWIRGVKPLGKIGAETEIEVKPALNASRTTAIRGWRLELIVNYSDGATCHFSSQDSGRLPDRVICLVPTRSARDGDAALIGYEAELAVRFTTISSIIIRKEFAVAMPRPLDGARERPAPMKKERIAILDACPVLDDASSQGAPRAIDVRWMADAPDHAVINRFHLELKATRADGTVGRVSKSVSGAQRQARLTLAPSGSEITSIKAGLGATFTWFGSTTVAKAGTFHD
jgi:hypothetical protein